MGWNRDENNPRVIKVEDKGSSFVVDWKTCKLLREVR